MNKTTYKDLDTKLLGFIIAETLTLLAKRYKISKRRVTARIALGDSKMNKAYDDVSRKAIKVALQVKQF